MAPKEDSREAAPASRLHFFRATEVPAEVHARDAGRRLALGPVRLRPGRRGCLDSRALGAEGTGKKSSAEAEPRTTGPSMLRWLPECSSLSGAQGGSAFVGGASGRSQWETGLKRRDLSGPGRLLCPAVVIMSYGPRE